MWIKTKEAMIEWVKEFRKWKWELHGKLNVKITEQHKTYYKIAVFQQYKALALGVTSRFFKTCMLLPHSNRHFTVNKHVFAGWPQDTFGAAEMALPTETTTEGSSLGAAERQKHAGRIANWLRKVRFVFDSSPNQKAGKKKRLHAKTSNSSPYAANFAFFLGGV